jgi:hypothetical protein
MRGRIGTTYNHLQADADASDLAPLAKFIARQQLHAFYLCKAEDLPNVPRQSSVFRQLRIKEAHNFIQQMASVVCAPYDRTVIGADKAPSLTVVSTCPRD